MIDSHCHLDHEPLYENIDDVLNRSKNIGLTKLLTICTTIKGFEKIQHLVNLDPIIYGTFGVHPHETKNNLADMDFIIKKVNSEKKIIGVGESGLIYYDHSDHKTQEKSFISHIEASLKLDVPNSTFTECRNLKHMRY